MKNTKFLQKQGDKSGIGLFDWVEQVQKLNVGEIIVTDIFSEGKNKGYNIDLFKKIRKNVDTQLVAHGGAGLMRTFLKFLKKVVSTLSQLLLYFIIII